MMEPIIKACMTELNTQMEGDVLKVCHSYGIDVDKERLMQALTDARKFYDEGYRDGKLDAGPKWISVEDRLPEESGAYLVVTKGGVCMKMVYSAVHRVFNAFDWGEANWPVDCDYWMPMLEMPKEG